MTTSWICSQIGSREHFIIPSILAENNRLELLLCDYWSRPGRLWEHIPHTGFKKLKERSHPSISGTQVQDTGASRLIFDFRQKRNGASTWEQIFARNTWYQDWHLAKLNQPEILRNLKEKPGIFFSYSYAAGKLFQFFKELGWKLILGQIDPGKLEEDIVRDETAAFPEFGANWSPAPSRYWELWKDEVSLADLIWVNSDWSKEAMAKQGVPTDKVEVIPLAYPQGSLTDPHKYPEAFSEERPLRLLFLGQINVRKGVHLLLQAMQTIPQAPVELHFVGPIHMTIPDTMKESRIQFHGAVSRQETQNHFKSSDAFILPTLSDGFAITQLEAQAYQLPLICSKFCAPVIKEDENGLLLEDLRPQTIAKAIQWCIENPLTLQRWSANSKVNKEFSLDSLKQRLLNTQLN